jgi:peptide/nickel transport system substrate-binding protein
MRRWWRTACLGIVAALAIAACGGSGSGSTPGPAPHGNVLQVSAPGEPDSLDPMGGISGFGVTFLYQIYDTLIHLDPESNKLQPELATSWEWTSADKLTLRVHLRHDVKFQDGTPLNAEAVKVSIEHAKTFTRWPDLAPVKSVTAVDPYTADINLSQPYAQLPAILSWRGGMIISPTALQKYGANFGRNPVGAGAFAFNSWQPGAVIKLTRFKDYWNASQTKLAGVDFKIIANPTAQVTALRAGQLDVGGLPNLENLPSVQGASNLDVITRNMTALSLITTANKSPPFNNPLVRRAANMSIDRHAIAVTANTKNLVDKGIGAPAWQYILPSEWPYSKNLKSYPYDPDQAKQLLAQAGYPNGVTVQLCNIQGNPDTIPQIEKQQMAKAGFTVVIQDEPVNSCLAKMQNGGVPMVQIGWAGLADPYQTYATMFGPFSSFGPYPGVNEMLAKAASSYTQQEQQQIYQQLNTMLFDLAPSIPLYYNVNVGITNKRVQGVEFTKIQFVTFFRHASVRAGT